MMNLSFRTNEQNSSVRQTREAFLFSTLRSLKHENGANIDDVVAKIVIYARNARLLILERACLFACETYEFVRKFCSVCKFLKTIFKSYLSNFKKLQKLLDSNAIIILQTQIFILKKH